ncbi:MAG: UDP-galactopyranose mutase [Paracoccaceae bacterium]|nr:UDP-galactopyranose mutase [Paracoccaceae bacterium]
MARILVVGCGFAGAVYARTLAEHGFDVHCIDQRPHIAGNAYDYVDENGVRVHKYGPHLFHTNNEKVFRWMTRFGAFVDYKHKVACRIEGGKLVPFPINRDTISQFFDAPLSDEASLEAFMARQRRDIAEPANAAEMLESKVGTTLTDTFFRRYTKKMWDMDLEDIHASVVQRVSVRFDRQDLYFPNDAIQVLPRDGYTALFGNILDHDRIRIELGVAFDKRMEKDYVFCFNSMAIDEYYDHAYGDLPYRSIRFHTEHRNTSDCDHWPVVNYTDMSPFTRETRWHNLPGHHVTPGPKVTVTVEEPCDYRDNNLERYYPVRTNDNKYGPLYERYAERAAADGGRLKFIGRCGTYQYLDMHQVINQSLSGVQKWLQTQKAA